MPFVPANLYKMSANYSGMQIWGYDAGADTIAAVNTTGYFNAAANDLQVGDGIRVKSSSGTVYTNVLVASNTGGVVDVTDGDTITATDSD